MISVFLHEIRPIVVIIVESHVTDVDEDALVGIKGYSSIRCDSDSVHTGGIVIYVNEEFSYEVVKNQRKTKSGGYWPLKYFLMPTK